MGLERIILDFFGFVGALDFSFLWRILFVVLIVFWLVIVGWVWIDSGERTSNTVARVIYSLIVLFLNVPGLIIYLIVRPSETIEEIYWADLERRYLKYETSGLGDCPSCGRQLNPGSVFCSNCGYDLKVKCPKCDVLVDRGDKYCSFCGFQLNKRVKKEEVATAEVMQQQILASREEATEVVESKRTRYKSGDSLVIKLGDSILTAWTDLKKVQLFTPKEKKVEVVKSVGDQKEQNKEVKEKNVSKSKKKTKSKKKKKNKR